MERNADDTFGASSAQGATTGGTGSPGSAGAGMSGSSAPSGDQNYAAGTTSGTSTGGTAGGTVDQAKGTVRDKMAQAKTKARELQSTLADRLDAGADKIRQRSQSSTLAGATGTSESVGVAPEAKMSKVEDSLARGMTKSADWLRNGDLRADVEKQVRENPGRTLLIALGLGYLLGKAFRNNR